jgi:integrase
MTWSHLDNPDNPTLWTTPFELTKSRKKQPSNRKGRTYLTPLPPLAQRILRGLPKGGADDRVFPTLRLYTNAARSKLFNDAPLIQRLRKRGAPADFKAHTWRHTIATYLEKEGHSEWERGLVLNHSGQGVTVDGITVTRPHSEPSAQGVYWQRGVPRWGTGEFPLTGSLSGAAAPP